MMHTRVIVRKANLAFLYPGAAVQFIGLNAVRTLSLASLILVFSNTIMNMVTNIKAVNAFGKNPGNSTMVDCEYIEGSSVPNQPAGAFRADFASLLIIFQMIILGLSEVEWPMSFFDRYFPVLGSHFGLGVLGIFQFLISIQILSHYVDDFTLISTFFLFALGCLNMLLGLIFRESAKAKRSIRSWRAEVRSVLPSPQDNHPVSVNNDFASKVSSSLAIRRPPLSASRQEDRIIDQRRIPIKKGHNYF